MASKDEVQKARPSPRAPPSTPSSSKDLLLSHPFMSEAQHFFEVVRAIADMQITSAAVQYYCCSHTPPNTPTQTPSQQITLGDLEQLFLKLIETKSPDLAGASEAAKTDASEGNQPETVARASRLEFKTVNEVWDKKACAYKVVESPKLVGEVHELDQYVFVVRRRIDRETIDTAFYVDVKSEGLRDILRTVLRDFQGISLKEDRLSVEQNLVYHYLSELKSLDDQTPLDLAYVTHLNLLTNYITTTYEATTKHLMSLLQSGEITYNLLWAFFKPNTLVYTTCHGTHKPRCVKYNFSEEKKTALGAKYWSLNCQYLDFDGNEFGDVTTELKIPKFRGAKRTDDLQAFPLQLHPDEDRVKADLVKCGQKFVSLMGTCHRHCHGAAFYMDDGQPVQVSIDSRVMIDPTFFRKINPIYSRPREMSGNVLVLSNGTEPPPSRVKSNGLEPAKMTENDFLVCCPTVPGFSLSDKLWVEFAVADIEDVTWSPLPFDCLTIPNEQREAIMALAEARTNQRSSTAFDDFVVGKGQGLNVLLHGPPGVGKTLTAEAASEHLRRPLYSISAGELNIEAGKLERQLSVIFEIASHWNAVLLLDEADVYLEKRSPHDIVRNGLVSVFLRKLEYCKGIIFLTTNRVTEFDEAILSRIHLMLKFDDLSSDTRKQIWEHFLAWARTPQGAADIRHKELELLVASNLNGRQIKNIMATAHALATTKGSKIRFSHLRNAVVASQKFISEFYGTDYVKSMFF